MTAINEFFCTVCKEPIPIERFARKAITCCAEHALMVKEARRKLHSDRRCRACNKPSNPEERKLFAQWRRQLPGHRKPGRPPKKKPVQEVPEK